MKKPSIFHAKKRTLLAVAGCVLKSYLIMAFMMGGGIWLRSSGLVPDTFIAVFYTGLGCALALAGVLFWMMFFTFCRQHEVTAA